MGLLHALLSLGISYFVTDFDGTIAHYSVNSNHSNRISLPGNNTIILEIIKADVNLCLFNLKASVGSGKVAYISEKTVHLLQEISEQNVTIICASGMRTSTMKQRIPFFPAIMYWICENGGKIFKRIEGGDVSELVAWREELDADIDSRKDLEHLQESLKNNSFGVHVDSEGYGSMIRIKGSSNQLRTIIQSLPGTLKYTFNLGP